MPITHTVDRSRRRMLTRAEGLVTYDEIAGHLAVEEVEHAADLPELFDARGAVTNLTAMEVRRLVARTHAMAQRMAIGPAAIVTDSEHFFGMARMYAVLAESAGIAVDVFEDLESALEWLAGWVETALPRKGGH